MEEKYEAIVIKCVNFGKSDRMLTVMTKQKGKLSVSAKYARNAKNKNHAATNLFALSQMVLSQKSEIASLYSADLLQGFYSIASKLSSYYFACYIFELICKGVEENQSDEILFFLLYHTLKNLDKANESFSLIIGTLFLIKFLALEGVCFDFAVNEKRDFCFSFEDGTILGENFLCEEGVGFFTYSQAMLYMDMLSSNVNEYSHYEKSHIGEVSKIFQVLNDFVKHYYHIEIKSYNTVETLLY